MEKREWRKRFDLNLAPTFTQHGEAARDDILA